MRPRAPLTARRSAWLTAAATVAGVGALSSTDARALEHEWREVGTMHFQIVSSPGEATEVTDEAEGNRGACTPGMVEVRGKMRVIPMGDALQKTTCTKWINKDFPERCASFDKDKWAAITAKLPTKEMRYCIDRFEYPNKKGEYPVIFVDWTSANAMCAKEKKRLCNEDEWTFACEGEATAPYPYGFVRDADACLVDKGWRAFHPEAFGRKTTLVGELDHLWQGAPSGARPKCKSPFGVYDLTGNVDEWTTATSGKRRSVLKGGYWGPVRTRCRPATRAHGETHAFYQQGLRCCSDLPAK